MLKNAARQGRPWNVLYLDKEGGFGGSSRSLYLLIKNLDRSEFTPYVLVREAGPVLHAYQELGVKVFLRKEMPLYKPSQRKNLYVLLLFLARLRGFLSSSRFLSGLLEEYSIDIVHFNHDGFFVYGPALKKNGKTKLLMHMRTMFPVNAFARRQAKSIQRHMDHLVFISENEVERLSTLLGREPGQYSIVFNPAAQLPSGREERDEVPQTDEDAFKVVYLGNLAYEKGADRLLEIAGELKGMGAKNVLFVVCGKDRGERKSSGRGLEHHVGARGLTEYFRLMGHQPEPERILRSANALVRLSRSNDPWGRDIIEAIASGLPVIATGTYDRFVEDSVNGYLHSVFSARKMAEQILYLRDHPEVAVGMKRANIEKGKLFDESTHAAKIAGIYRSWQTVSADHPSSRCAP
jgi:glycosyltransferase involved in cell wall biosynthesis